MIAGVVRSDEARVRLTVKNARARGRKIEAVVDTGFNSALTLPPSVIQALGLRWQSLDRCTLADGSECLFDVYEATIEWDGKPRQILVDEAECAPLIGMALLRGYELKMQVRPRGTVTIKRLR